MNKKYAEQVLTRYRVNVDKKSKISDLLNTIRKYISKHGMIMTGGTAIDQALKLAGEKGIYDHNLESETDYDIFTDTVDHAYNMALKLVKLGYENINVIPALHVSTMKIRIGFTDLVDITYIPKKLYDAIPYFMYKGIKIEDPGYKMIFQHRAFCYPFNGGIELIQISHRWKKDIERNNLLWDLVKPKYLSPFNKKSYVKNMVSINYSGLTSTLKTMGLSKIAMSGELALSFWLRIAISAGYKIPESLQRPGLTTTSSLPGNSPLEFVIDTDYYDYGLINDEPPALLGNLTNGNWNYNNYMKTATKMGLIEYRSPLLDIVPPKLVICANNNIVLIRGEGLKISAIVSDIDDRVYVVCLQWLLMRYLYSIWTDKGKPGKGNAGDNWMSKEDLRIRFMLCRDMLDWSYANIDNENARKLLPTVSTYGYRSIGRHYYAWKERTIKGKTNLVPRPLFFNETNADNIEKIPEFDPTASSLYQLDGGIA